MPDYTYGYHNFFISFITICIWKIYKIHELILNVLLVNEPAV